jgi:hypothetical protein
MIDIVYKTLLTIINKENQGYINPTEFNLLANNVQQEIFRGYFEDENRDKNKENSGSSNRGYSNLPFNQRQRIDQFAEIGNITKTGDYFNLPQDLYFIEDDGILSLSGKVIEEIERSQIGYLMQTEAAPTEQYPVYERYNNKIQIYPETLIEAKLRYLRTPKMPNWTYFSISDSEPMFNPANASFQDFELHESEFSNIVLKMLGFFGINLREAEVVQIAETLKDKMNIKDNN